MPTRREFLAAAAAGACAPAPLFGEVPASRCEGIWVGGFRTGDGFAVADFNLAVPGSASVNAFQLGLSNRPASLSCTGRGIALSFTGRDGAGSFQGAVQGDHLRGRLTLANRTLAGEFQRSAAHRPAEYDQLLGAYRSSTGDLLVIGRVPFSPRISLINFTTGTLRTLYPSPDGEYFYGPSFAVPAPAAGHLAVDRATRRLRMTGGRSAVPLPARVEDVSIATDDGIALMGTLRMPEGEGPFPVIVFAHGSGPADRHGFLSLQYLLPDWGIATLAFDKRGGGRSGGQFVHSVERDNLERLARDLASVVAFTRTHAKVDARRTGVLGISQAGWVVPIVAGLVPDLAATVLISGPPVPTGIENAYSILTGDGAHATLPQAEIERRVAATPPSGFDPEPFIREMHMPALWLFGARDQSVPARLCYAALNRIRAAGQSNLEAILYETGTHALWEMEHGTQAEFPLVNRFVPGFIPDLKAWLDRHLVAREGRPT